MFTESLRRMWSGEKSGPLLQAALPFLTAASWIYTSAVRTRRWGYRIGILPRESLPIPVLSVGNLTVGGSGKTPLTIAIAELLLRRGLRVAVLSRGYGGKEPDTPLVVSDGRTILCDDPERAGDEPILIARRVSGAVVIVCRYRWKAGMLAAADYDCQVAILDDGFQHLPLARGMDILICRTPNPWGNARLLPRGPLREPLSAIGRANLVVLLAENGEGALQIPSEIESSGIPHVTAKPKVSGINAFWPPGGATTVTDLGGKRALLMSAIGSPQSFENLVEKSGATVTGHAVFRDHHPYSPDDVRAVWERARGEKADLVLMTEKDGVKIRRILIAGKNVELPPIPAVELSISLEFPEDELFSAISRCLLLPTPAGRP